MKKESSGASGEKAGAKLPKEKNGGRPARLFKDGAEAADERRGAAAVQGGAFFKCRALFKKAGLQIFLVLLAALYFFSAPKTERFERSAFLNPKYEADKIALSEPGRGTLVLKKAGSFWFGQAEIPGKKGLLFFCDSILVKRLLDNLKSLVKMYEISDSKNAEARYGLDESRAFSLSIFQNEREISSVRFGSVDSRERIFFAADKKTNVWSTDSAPLAPYLTADAAFWADPEIFPKAVVGADKKYRHGKPALDADGKPLLAEELDWTRAAAKEFDPGDGSLFRALFLPDESGGGDYFFRLESLPSAQRTDEEKAALKKINAVFSSSVWTFSRVMEDGE